MSGPEVPVLDDDRPVLVVDLGAVVANWRQLAARSRPAETAAVVKADAFGLGMSEVAPALSRAGARTFFVATVTEGVRLRGLLPAADIYVLNGASRLGAAELLRHGLRPCLCSLDQLAVWQAQGEGRPAALHIDTGINRLGMGPDEVGRLLADRALLTGIEISLVMSHLACGEEPGHPFNRRQLEAFRKAVGALGLEGRPLSLAASSGIFLGSDFHLSLVRPGASIYGLRVLNDRPNPMRQVLKLEAKIIQVRRVDRGMTVGYGATHPVSGPGRLAILGLGYADGFLRALGSRGYAVLGDMRIPVVGRVSMDLTTLDVSAVPQDLARPGASVEIIGAHQTIDDLAAQAGSIGYELMTLLGRRYRRVYLAGENDAEGGQP